MSAAEDALPFSIECIAQEAEQFFRDLQTGKVQNQCPTWPWLRYRGDIVTTQPWSENLERVIHAAFQHYRYFHLGSDSEGIWNPASIIVRNIKSKLKDDFTRQERVLALALDAGLSELELAKLLIGNYEPFSSIMRELAPIGPEKLTYEEFTRKHGWNANFADWMSKEEVLFNTRFTQFVWNLSDEDWSKLLPVYPSGHHWGVLRLLATFRPQAVHLWLNRIVESGTSYGASALEHLPVANREFDEACWEQVERLRELCANPSEGTDPSMCSYKIWTILQSLFAVRPEIHEARILQIANDPLLGVCIYSLFWLEKHHPELCMRMLLRAINQPPYPLDWSYYGKVIFRFASQRLDSDGKAAFDAVCETRNALLAVSSLPNLLKHAPADANAHKIEIIAKYLGLFRKAEDQEQMWTTLVEHDVRPILALAWEALCSKSKKVRRLAAEGIHRSLGESAMEQALTQLKDKRVESRLGAVELLGKMATAQTATLLQGILTTESAEKVRGEVHALLKRLPPPEHQGDSSNLPMLTPQGSLDSLLMELTQKLGPTGALPKWLNLDALPPLSIHGQGSERDLLTRWIALQSKFGEMAPAPDCLALLPYINREKSGELGLAILEAWLSEGADAKKRWALVLAGWLGDERIASRLSDNIPIWCKQARHKVAEYAAFALGLQGGDAATRVLHACSVQYSQHFPNVGAAAAQGLSSIELHRGITRSQLSETSLPLLGFNDAGVQVWSQENWAIQGAVDFRGGLVLKNLADGTTFETWPRYTPWTIEAAVESFGQVFRRLMKEQVACHAEALKEGRSWPIEVWTRLYNGHPLRRHFGSSLIWMALSADARPMGAFHLDVHGRAVNAQGQPAPVGNEPARVMLADSSHFTRMELKDWKGRFASLQLKSPLRQLSR